MSIQAFLVYLLINNGYLFTKCEWFERVEIENSYEEITKCKCFFSHGTWYSKGVALLILKVLNINVSQTRSEIDGRRLVMDIKVEDTKYIIMNTVHPHKQI